MRVYLDCYDCAEVVDEGSKQDDEEADAAGFSPAGFTGSGVIIVWIGQVKGE